MLPPELLNGILDHLSPSAYLALLQTCRHLYYTHDRASVRKLYLDAREIPTERFEVLSFHDGFAGRYVCGDCRIYHPRNWFDEDELGQTPARRSCRSVYICPHIRLNLLQYQAVLAALKRSQPTFSRLSRADSSRLHRWTKCVRAQDHRCGGYIRPTTAWRVKSPLTVTFGLRRFWTMPLSNHPELPTSDERGLGLADVAVVKSWPEYNEVVCPHLRLFQCLERLVAYEPLRPSYGTEKVRRTVCTLCATEICGWLSSAYVHLGVFRYLGRVRSPVDPVWLAQVESRPLSAAQASRGVDHFHIVDPGLVRAFF
ncbi:MAG: hypothetical protein M1817_000424 [Caeruleum heppii]|nr:MAG: hypothetical protein M1817_000424 [Caeruleum heppii]